MTPVIPGRAAALTLAVVGLLTAGTAAADTVQLNPSQDGTLYEQALGELASGAGPTLFVGRTAIGFEDIRRGLIQFDVAGAVPAGSTITAVTLRLYMSRSIAGDVTCTVHRVGTPWGEGSSDSGVNGGTGALATPGDATWIYSVYPGANWTTPGGDFVAAASASATVGLANGFYTWTSTPELVADVQDMLDNAAGNHGWLLKGDESTTATAKRFNTSESDPTSLDTRPLLTVEYSPRVIPVEASTWSRIKGQYR